MLAVPETPLNALRSLPPTKVITDRLTSATGSDKKIYRAESELPLRA